MIFTQIFLVIILFVITNAQNYNQNQNDYVENYDTSQSVSLSSPITRTTIKDEEYLLNQYRQLIVKSLINLDDSCKVYDFLVDVGKQWSKKIDEEKIDDNTNGNYLNILLEMIRNSNTQQPLLSTDNNNNNNNNNSTKKALYYFLSTSAFLKDSELDKKLRNLLYEKCCRESNGIFYYPINCPLDKRNTIKKIRFHSWGGKRNSPSEVPKIVIRTPFRPWGGKRSNDPTTSIMNAIKSSQQQQNNIDEEIS